MKVTLIAHTKLVDIPESIADTNFGRYVDDLMTDHFDDDWSDADTLSHLAGRGCYQAWEMPNPRTSNNVGYLNNILNQQHYSVVEHASVTFYLEDVSRTLLAELTRHRHVSFSVESQRYVDYSDTTPVIPPASRGFEEEERFVSERYASSVADYEHYYDILTARGLPRKEAREAARSVLLNAAPVAMTVSGNHRAWRDVLGKRFHPAADKEIYELATALLEQLKVIAPGIYQDIEL